MTLKSMPPAGPAGYGAGQIVLHWLIAALMIFQLLFGEDIKPAYRAFVRGTTPGAADLLSADLHVYVGWTILVLAVLRLALRLRQGAPSVPSGESLALQRIARGTHALLYAFIFGMPISGALAWYLGIGTSGEIHELAKPLIIVVVALHVLGALWQHFVAKSDVLVRMLKPMARHRSQA